MGKKRNETYHKLNFRRSSSSCSNNSNEGVKKAKIGVTIKKSPNSDRTFESRLLDQEFDNMSIKNKVLDVGYAFLQKQEESYLLINFIF